MTVLAAAVTTKAGKLLVSRQYVNFSRVRIEGLLTAFPKLIDSEQQHTYVETDAVRYVYQPVESLYVLMITTKASNILEDLETLRLLGKILPEYSPRYGVVDEITVLEAAFEIICSFDEVVNWGGSRESVGLSQIATFTEMYSHEERLAKMIEESKMLEAKEEAKRKAASIRQQRGEGDKLAMFGGEIGKMMQTAGLGGLAKDLGLTKPPGASSAGRTGISSESYAAQQAAMAGMDMGGGMGVGGMNPGMAGMGSMGNTSRTGISSASFSSTMAPYGSSATSGAPAVSAGAGKGMALGKARKQDTLLAAMRAEGEVVEALPTAPRPRAGGDSGAAAPAVFAVSTEAVHLSALEKISVQLNRDGGVENVDIKGHLMLRISDESKAAVRIAVQVGSQTGIQVQTHPNIDKSLFSGQSVLGLKDPSRPFPVGNTPILRWRSTTKDESLVPLMITCWPSDTGSDCQVNVEYELTTQQELRDVLIAIPTQSGSIAPQVVEMDTGDFGFNARTQCVEWKVPVIDASSRNGQLEFRIAMRNVDAFFPVHVSFSSKSTFLPVHVASVVAAVSGETSKFSADALLSTESYVVS
ncbi:Coatomer subunit delta [Porphyridium purpureum]|uniref:Coatomer subunit delta n=1 Tax=Porphyridium purpureum TaxID=35688 RepID=A0A5J4Z7R6_PORPP|nr:Coatomer subunit delta [Porphyridium purpureum]|eukprot:POR8131..scf295_1